MCSYYLSVISRSTLIIYLWYDGKKLNNLSVFEVICTEDVSQFWISGCINPFRICPENTHLFYITVLYIIIINERVKGLIHIHVRLWFLYLLYLFADVWMQTCLHFWCDFSKWLASKLRISFSCVAVHQKRRKYLERQKRSSALYMHSSK